MTDGQGAVFRLRRVGNRLRRYRIAAGRTSVEAAEYLGCSHSKISKLETGRFGVHTDELRRLLDYYGVPAPGVDELVQINEQVHRREWWQPFREAAPEWLQLALSLEAEAEEIREYRCEEVPVLLQTEEYATATLLAGEPEMGEAAVRGPLELRMARQQVLTKDEPVELAVVVSEAALRRVVGDHQIMHGQLDHLVELADSPVIDIRILPFTAPGCPPVSCSFTILDFPDEEDPIAYIDHVAGVTYLDKSASEVGHYHRAFGRLRAAALDPDESRAMLAEVAADYG